MRIKLATETAVAAGATKTITVYAPQGFRVIAPWFDFAAGGAVDGTIHLLKSKPTMDDEWLEEDMSNFPLADGSTAVTIPVEGWVFKVHNGDDSSRTLLCGLVCEEGSIVTTHYYNNGDYPKTVV
jgi:hypothetical protein